MALQKLEIAQETFLHSIEGENMHSISFFVISRVYLIQVDRNKSKIKLVLPSFIF